MQAPTAHHLLLTDATLAAAYHGPDVLAPTLAAAEWHTALADIARLVAANGQLPDEAFRAAVRKVFDFRPMPGLTAALGPGSTGEDAARLIGGMLAALDVTYTAVVAAVTREKPRVETIGDPAVRPMTAAEAADLDLPGRLAEVWSRRGLMRAGTTITGEVAVTLIKAKVSADELAAIEAGQPAGAVLGDLRRVWPSVKVCWPRDPGLLTAAALERAGQVIGWASERTGHEFLDRLAKAATS